MAPYKILRQGYMHKEPPPSKRGLRKKLHRYWFVLVEDEQQIALVYFKNEDDFLLRRRNEGVVRVDTAFAISVVGEYMGCKNGLSLKTPRNEYVLVAESRYEVHEWLYTLHHALESFRKKHRRPRSSRRSRSNTMEVGVATAKTPPPTPSRKAPPPPSSANGKPRRKPVRPAPAAPIKRQSSSEATTSSPINNTHPAPQTPPLAFTTDPFLSQEQPPAVTYDRHLTVDMDFSQGEEAQLPPPRQRSSSDSQVLRERTRSLPDLMDPDVMSQDDDDKLCSPIEIPGLHSPSKKHTRHLSLTSPMGTDIKHFGIKKKRTARRQGSLKHRSRSPPELPPPPPPPEGQEDSGDSPSHDVMNTTSNIDQQLEHMNGSSEFHSIPPQPSIPVPQRSPFSYTRTSPVPEQPMEEEEGQAAESGEEGRLSPEGAHALPDEPLPADMAFPFTHDVAAEHSESNGHTDLNRKKQVMFKEEVEDIPNSFEPLVAGNSYEPRVDHEFDTPSPPLEGQQHPESGVDEDIPRSVAALKRMLFGGQEETAQRYPKEESSLSPLYAQPENFVFDEGFNFAREVPPDDNHNNNNVTENLYERPWEQKTVAKYKVVGVRHRGMNYSPPTTTSKLQFGEVLAVDTPVPGSTELCNVTSLERVKKKKAVVEEEEEDGDSLLSSINNTLQAFARYGSDSLLLRRTQSAGGGLGGGGGGKESVRSTRRELEKIRAAHRRNELTGHGRMALSLDELGDTEVAFDSAAQAHVFRSLV